jgi:cellulose synthase/poly-beta-1,6-N-acetylglucosamine synthase-like glycosyltransferase
MSGIALIFVVGLAGLTLAYGIVVSGFLRGLRKLRCFRQRTFEIWPTVSVVLPARNEAEVLERTLYSLFDQDYPGEWEIIVVDDRSTDETPRIIDRLSRLNPRLRFFRVNELNPRSPKKYALALGIRQSQADIVITTDADCEYDSGWIRVMVSYMTPEVGVVAGITAFDLPGEDDPPAWQKIQWLDFLAQQFLAAGAAGAGVPSSCNGSNLAYRREVYNQISGFGESALQVSGDDVLFAQRVAKLTHWRVVFAVAPESIVRSLPVLTIREMFHQRIRWASKGLSYRRSMSVFLFGMYLYYFAWIAAPIVGLLVPSSLPILAATAAWKLIWDWVTLYAGCKIFGYRELLRYFLPFVALHMLLSPVFGIAGLLMPYRWKGEWYRTARLPLGVRRGLVRVRRLVRHRRAVESSI